MAVGFEQAAIPIERQQEFAALRGAIREVFAPALAAKFLGLLKKHRVMVRDFEQVLAKRLIESAHAGMKTSGQRAQALYESLAMSDQAQIREFYLQELEKVEPALRRKFSDLYRY